MRSTVHMQTFVFDVVPMSMHHACSGEMEQMAHSRQHHCRSINPSTQMGRKVKLVELVSKSGRPLNEPSV